MPLAGVVGLLALPAGAQADAPVKLLPDLVQEVPQPLSAIKPWKDPETGHYVLGFYSIVGNVGTGPLEIHGQGPGNADMVAHQVFHWSDDTITEGSDQVGVVHYEDELANHNHWHLQPFDNYELRSLDGNVVAPYQKEGFCLTNSLEIPFSGTRGPQDEFWWDQPDPRYFCRLGQPEATDITEGIGIGWADEYEPFRGGQSVDLSGVPAGRYYLVQEVNADHSIQELGNNYANDVWSAAIDLSWPGGPNAMPSVTVLNSCQGSATCPYTDPPPPPGPTPAGPDKTAPKLLLGGATRQRLLRGRTIYVYAKCDEVCTITASGRIAALQVAKSLRTKTAKVKLKPGVRTKIKLRMSKRTRRLVVRQLRKRGARVTVRVTLVAVDAAGNRTGIEHRTLVLLPRPR